MRAIVAILFIAFATFIDPYRVIGDNQQEAVSWAHKYSFDDGFQIRQFSPRTSIVTNDGGFLIGSGGTLLKLDHLGEASWQKSYDCFCNISALVESPSNGYLAASTTGFLDESYIILLRIDKTGNLLWSKRYRQKRFDSAQSLIRTRDGGYLLGAFSANVASKKDGKAWLLKIGGSGNIQWQKTYNVARPNSLHQSTNGDFLVATEQFSVLRLSKSGTVRSQRKFSGDGCCTGGMMKADNLNGFVLAGNQVKNSVNSIVLLRVASSGTVIFSKAYSKQELVDVTQTSDGGYVFLSRRLSFPAPQRISISKVDGNGNVSWRRVSKTHDLITPINVVQAADNGYLVTSLDNFILKVDQSGNIPNICRNVFASAATTIENISIKVEPRFPTVSAASGTAIVENFSSSDVVPIVETICSP